MYKVLKDKLKNITLEEKQEIKAKIEKITT